jgi:predicted nuclease of predicted toxin-antitoxin system
MRFKLDENMPLGAAELLTQAGHDALTIHDQQLVGEPDPRVVAVCRAEQRALVTLDLDFSDIRTYPPGDHVGIIVLRPRTQGRQAVLNLVARLVPLLTTEPLAGTLWILDESNLRIREGERSPDADP